MTLPRDESTRAATNERAQALVVSGFLGSGKTTLVRRLLEQGQRDGIRTAVVSNEFGELGIDEALLASTGGDFVELAGGCVCCRLSDDLLKTLQMLWEKARPERVIVETSGLALPYDTLINFWRDPVRRWAVDESSVVVVSAEQVAAGRELDSTFEDQVCSADLLVLSKTDLLKADEIEGVHARLGALAADVQILTASFGEVDARVFFPPDPGSSPPRPDRIAEPAAGYQQAAAYPRGETHHHHSHADFTSQEVGFAEGIAASEVETVLAARAALRAKGFVSTSEGLRLVQGVAGRIELTVPTTAPPAHLIGRVVVIERRQP